MFRPASFTTEGMRKKTNQDAHCVLAAEADCGLVVFAAVCDGVGGLALDEMASSTVISRFVRWFEEELPCYLRHNSANGSVSLEALKNVWLQLIARLNKSIFAYGEQSGNRLGTTFTGLIMCQGSYLIGHVGDCRAYRCNRGGFVSLTSDQTYVAREVARGNITPEEARNHPKRNVLLQAVGTQESVRPEFVTGTFSEGELFVLCCDGFYRRLGDGALAEAFGRALCAKEAELSKVCEALSRKTMELGETDNITVACVSVGACGAAPQGDDATTLLDEDEADFNEATTLLDEADAEDAATTLLDGADAEDAATTLLDDTDVDDATTTLLAAEGSEDDIDAPTSILDGTCGKGGDGSWPR